MFYSEFVLAKKSPLGHVWLAAHWTKKLTPAMIARSDVVEACNSIIKPPAPLALRTSGHLLLGVVRIHDSKQKVLMSDCSNALVKIKACLADTLASHWRQVAFRPGAVDMPVGNTAAAFNAITLPETLTDFDSAFPLDLEFEP
jgi:cohesin complex subunit SCC1